MNWRVLMLTEVSGLRRAAREGLTQAVDSMDGVYLTRGSNERAFRTVPWSMRLLRLGSVVHPPNGVARSPPQTRPKGPLR
jgi:hypothetical protein